MFSDTGVNRGRGLLLACEDDTYEELGTELVVAEKTDAPSDALPEVLAV